MSLTRSELRVKIMIILYQIFLYGEKIEYNIGDVIKENLEIDNEFVKEVVHGVLEHKEEITTVANKYLSNWTIDRLGLTDQAILCIGIYELLYTDTPGIVVINESVELAKEYSDDKVVKMINAVLDEVYHNEESYES